MAEKKYQVFISSTYRDLIEHRRDIIKSVLDLGHIPAAMEYFPASDEEQFRYIKRVIDQCDYYVLVLAGKYGSLAPDGVSYTEKEYDYAVGKNKFVLGFPIKEIDKLPREQTEDGDKAKSLLTFRTKVMDGRLVREWNDRPHLDNQVTKALAIAFTEFPQDGWVRSPKNSNEHLLEEINDLRKKNARLEVEIKSLQSPERIDLNLVDLSATITFKIWGRSLERREEKSCHMTWHRIFIQLASILHGASDRSIISSRFATLIYPNFASCYRCGVEDSSWELILIQLSAYGFLKTDDRNIYELTPFGLEKYTQSVVLRGS